MMSWLRAAFRFTLLLVFVLVMYSWLMVSSFFLGVFNVLRGRGFWSSTDVWRSGIFHSWGGWVLPLLGIRLTVRGTPPAAPFLLVSNHLSYLDILVLASQLPAVFIAKSEVKGWPVLGTLCRLVDTQFIQRERKNDILRMLKRITEILESGRGVVFFPEGTTSNGQGVQPFKPALLAVAAKSGEPVAHAALSYAVPPGSPPASDSVCWWGGADFAGHFLTVLRMPRIDATVRFGARKIHEHDRKVLARRLQVAVRREFTPVV
jgi:1-acyl-sn-glycerol-3-phosphate acyltransferase